VDWQRVSDIYCRLLYAEVPAKSIALSAERWDALELGWWALQLASKALFRGEDQTGRLTLGATSPSLVYYPLILGFTPLWLQHLYVDA
jgi:hypothetical protein